MDKLRLQQELKQSMLARDKLKTSVLRLLLSSINYYEIQEGGAGYSATDEDVITVLQKEIKQRKESIEQFKAGGRQDLVDKETRELEILQAYLPEQMSNEEIKKLVIEAIKETNALTLADMGKVMAVLMPKIKGKAEGGLVNQIVRSELA